MRLTNILLVTAIATIIACAGIIHIHSDSNAVEEKYGIICAMDVEIELLLSSMEEDTVEKISGTDYHIGKLCGKDVVLVKCGYGKVNAAMHTQTLIDRYGVTAVINSGVAGTLDENVGIGDIVVSTETVQHDFEMTEIGWEPGLIPEVGTVAIKADAHLRQRAVTGIHAADPNIKVFQGRVCTGDQFINGEDEMHKIIDVFGGLCCEMEGGSIAQVCFLNDVPFVVIRAISDDVDGTKPEDYPAFEKQMARVCAEMTINILKAL